MLSCILLELHITCKMLELKILLREILNLDWQQDFLRKFLNLDWHWYFKNINLESCLMGQNVSWSTQLNWHIYWIYVFIVCRLNRDMNNKKVSCVAKNNDINDPKTRTVTVQMNCKYNNTPCKYKCNIYFSKSC